MVTRDLRGNLGLWGRRDLLVRKEKAECLVCLVPQDPLEREVRLVTSLK